VDFVLKRHIPALDVPWLQLGEYPTPVQHVAGLDVWLKREDISSPLYGGNKVRTLETLFAQAQARGLKRVWTLGAYGSNQAVAAAVHGRRIGLEIRAALFPQRATATAAENLRACFSHAARVRLLRTVATVPLHWWALSRSGSEYFVPPGGAVPLGALGHVGAALELAEQVSAGKLPAPRHIVLAVGSNCTTAGLLVGLPLAQQLGLWKGELPLIHAVRVTPWPVTARSAILKLARATARYLEQVGGPRVEVQPGMLVLNTRHFGWGYARVTRDGLAAAAKFASHGAPALDTTYAAKSGAALLALVEDRDSPLRGQSLFWCTKSSVPMPAMDEAKLADVPGYIRRWLKRADNSSASA